MKSRESNFRTKPKNTIMKLRLLLFAGLIVLFSNFNFSQTFEWVSTGGDFGLDLAHSVVNDEDGNIYTVGFFSGTVNFNEGGEATELTATGARSAFILKQSSDKTLVWVKLIASGIGSDAQEILLSEDGDVYVTGNFQGETDFDPGVGEFLVSSAVGENAYVLKLDSDGNFIWVKTFQADANARIWASRLDKDGNLINVGNFAGMVDFDPGAGEALRTAGEFREIFVQKMNSDGEFLWVNHYASTEDDADVATSVITQNDGSIILTGLFYGTVDFDLGDGVEELTAMSSGGSYTLKLSADGEFSWVKQITGAGTQSLNRDLTADPDDNIYVLGRFEGEMDLDPGLEEVTHISNGGFDIFIQKFSADGDLIWVRTLGGLASDYTARIVYDETDNICAFVNYAGTVDVDPSIDGELNFTAVGGYDGLCLTLNPAGDFVWAFSFGGSLNDIAIGFTADANHNLYLTGYYAGTADFDAGAGTAFKTSNGGDDFFILKMSETLSINEIEGNAKGLIYPNPANHFVNVNAAGYDKIEILDFSGRLVFQTTATNGIEEIDVSNFQSGVYFVSLKGESYTITKKLIVK